MMISRPMIAYQPPVDRGHSDSPLHPHDYLQSKWPHGGRNAAVIRTQGFTFNPRILPPVNKITGSPRPNG
jgi:hypothetical protein